MENYRLEYNETQGRVHLDNYTHVENTFGWITILRCISNNEATVFLNKMDKKYSGLYNFGYRLKKSIPTLKQFVKEFETFHAVYEKLTIEYEVHHEKNVLILRRKKGEELTEICAFCFTRHTHGKANGHRCPHCARRNSNDYVISNDGAIIYLEDGYIIKDIIE